MNEQLDSKLKDSLKILHDLSTEGEQLAVKVMAAREEIAELMVQGNVRSTDCPIHDANGVPIRNVIARMDPLTKVSLDEKKLKGLMTEKEIEHFTKFNVSATKVEEALAKGVIHREDVDVEREIRACITREKVGDKLVITGLGTR